VRIDARPQPIEADDEQLAAAVARADVPALLTAVAHLTGDLDLLREDLRPDPDRVMEPDAGLTPEQKAEGRALAAAALCRYRDGGSVPAPPPDDEALRRLVEFLVGPEPGEWMPVLVEELALDGADLRAPEWHKDDLAPDRPFTVAIIGAGMSGIAVAHRLDQAGVPIVIFEKNPDVGGTWWENAYPGCRVDVPNHLYSYSFAQTGDWPQYYSDQPALQSYFGHCVDHFGLRPHIRFGTEVERCDWDEDRQVWTVRVRTPDGEEEHEAQVVVSAVGQLNRPLFPDIPGRDRFAGPSFHSAQWDDGVDLDGARVAVIGTGASAMQLIPEVAGRAGELLVFQRTPAWLVPTPNYHDDLSEGLRWLLRHVPEYARWDRLWWFWRLHEGLLPMARVDPDWADQERSVSAANDLARELFTAYIRSQFPDDEAFEKVLPRYPPVAKRVVRDNGIWARTLGRENVELITDGIAEITEKGVRMVDGTEHVVDVIVYGTGFQASRFLTPMRVTGVGGVDLHERWDGEARAYLGLTIPEFPNLFLMYGPNTNLVINGSIIYFSECEARYILESVRLLLAEGRGAMEVRADVHDAYNEGVDAENRQMAWGASSVNTWYKNASGRVTQNWPYSLLDYWERTRAPDPEDYVLR
jgi:4-hydroxyacetophenone monooxygenase